MPHYVYDLTNIKIQLDVPFAIQIGGESSPFLTEGTAPCETKIMFRAVERLPEIPKEGCWVEDRWYGRLNGADAVFVRNAYDLPPYVLVTETQEGLLCRYLTGFEHYFRNSGDILNLLGLEKLLLMHRGLLLHASLIRWQGRGIAFSAPCGVGKSTQAALWEQYLGSETLNGDRAGIRCDGGIWNGYGMPFAGSSGVYRNAAVPLSAIVVLSQASENRICRLSPMEAVRKLLPECSCRRWDRGFMDRLLENLLSMIQQVPIYQLECRPDREAVLLLRDTILENEAFMIDETLLQCGLPTADHRDYEQKGNEPCSKIKRN